MDLFTKVDIPKSNISIDYNSKLMFVGSCFAENISRFFVDAKFNCLVNPTGIIYNPLSIRQMVANVVNQKIYDEHDFLFDGNNYCSYDFHGAYSRGTLQEAVALANNCMIDAYNYLKNADILFVTLGTAYVYFLADNPTQPVCNCHKQKPETFIRRLVSVDEVAAALSDIVLNLLTINSNLSSLNSKLKIVFTVSPIRHLRDGAHGNRLSKSTLHLGVEQILRKFDCCEYFPSYEILEDELRDYRFFAEDMVHPSPLAEKIIWQRLRDTYINKVCQLQISRVEKFMQAVHHRIIDPVSPATREFCKKNLALADALESEIQGLDLSVEKKYFKNIL
ncbi:MAG: GSCFA domain-containing protein [Bacteroidales bacterium]|nr:GSCFA domain-containing protein [Bacteroidales bacterium]